MKLTYRFVIPCLVFIAVVFSVLSCRPGESGDSESDTAVAPSKAYLDRKAAYLAHCAANTANGGVHGQVCAAYLGSGVFNPNVINEKLDEKIIPRLGTADFDINSIIRALWFDRQNPSLPDALRDKMTFGVLNFRYWLDEPIPDPPDTLCWWSENHQILFHTAEYTAGLLYPDTVFPNSGMTGKQHAEHALPYLHRWLDYRGRFGFSEWHSNVYFKEDMPPLVNLVDFADDEAIRTKAAMLLDTLAFDMLCNHYKGLFATTHGRTYPSKYLNGLNDSTREAVYMLTGLAEPASITELGNSDFVAAYLATSERYYPPAILDAVADDSRDYMEHRQRDSILVTDGPALGITYTAFEDVMFWWGMTGYVSPYVVEGTLNMVDHFNMWEGDTWKDLVFLKPFIGDPLVVQIIEAMAPVSQGVMLERVNTYTYRTPFYQLSAAQDWKPGSMTGQVLTWIAAIDRDAFVFTSFPSNEGDSPLGEGVLGGLWTGGFVPRATLYKNVGVIQYKMPELDDLSWFLGGSGIDWSKYLLDYNHAYFPKNEFDEVVEFGHWTIGKKADSYAALYSEVETRWSSTVDYELIAGSTENVWIIEMGDAENNGPFADFVAYIINAGVQTGDTVRYESPSRGTIEVGWTGPMTVNGGPVDLGPYPRWDNPYCYQEFDTGKTVISFEGKRLELDWKTPRRTYVEKPIMKIGTGDQPK
jgi:hypothetical protein